MAKLAALGHGATRWRGKGTDDILVHGEDDDDAAWRGCARDAEEVARFGGMPTVRTA